MAVSDGSTLRLRRPRGSHGPAPERRRPVAGHRSARRFPPSPRKASLPPPPRSRSGPPPPFRRSFPSPPVRTFAPPEPVRESALPEPVKFSVEVAQSFPWPLAIPFRSEATIAALAPAEGRRVDASTAGDEVVAEAGGNRIVPLLPGEDVVATASKKPVVPGTAEDDVVSLATLDDVVSAPGADDVAFGRAGDHLARTRAVDRAERLPVRPCVRESARLERHDVGSVGIHDEEQSCRPISPGPRDGTTGHVSFPARGLAGAGCGAASESRALSGRHAP